MIIYFADDSSVFLGQARKLTLRHNAVSMIHAALIHLSIVEGAARHHELNIDLTQDGACTLLPERVGETESCHVMDLWSCRRFVLERVIYCGGFVSGFQI